MLKEKILFKEELPVNVLVAEIENYPIHFHEELEVVFVLKGQVSLRNGYYTYTLKEGDIFILNDREIHSFARIQGEENMVMMVQLDLGYFSAYYENLKNNFFVTDMEDDDDESLELLRNILARIMMEVLQKGHGYEHKVIESTHNLITNLQGEFQYFLMEDGKFVNETKKRGNKVLAGRLNRITDYMYDHYNRKLTLNEIAEREHLSIYYLSHVIKEATGLSFQDLLSFIRVEESEKLLLGTKKKISTVAEETGFSAVRYYIKHFEHWFGMHPLEYREAYTGRVSGRESTAQFRKCTPAEIEEVLRDRVQGVYKSYSITEQGKPRIINIDFNSSEIEKDLEIDIETLAQIPGLEILTAPYKVLMDLKEERLAAGKGYVVTGQKTGGKISSLSIFVYNRHENLRVSDLKYMDKKAMVDELQSFEDYIEVLLRCSGISGEFSMARYKISKRNIEMALLGSIEGGQGTSRREELKRKWAMRPAVEFGRVSIADTLSLRCPLEGYSGEMILLDRNNTNNDNS